MQYIYFISLIFLLLILYVLYLKLYQRLRRLKRVDYEDVLKIIYHQTHAGKPVVVETIKGALRLSSRRIYKILQELQKSNMIRVASGGIHLSDDGRTLVLEIIRAHRILETFLHRETALPFYRIHELADKGEHDLRGERLEALNAHLGFPRIDPHGDPIPRADGSMEQKNALSLTDWPLEIDGRIVHIEDEPSEVGHRLFKLGFSVDDHIRIIDKKDGELTVRHNGHTYRLTVLEALNIQVSEVQEGTRVMQRTLSQLKQDETAIISGFSSSLQGLPRRRLLDLGFTPGVPITKKLISSFGGDPTVYQVRGSKIALRREQAGKIFIE